VSAFKQPLSALLQSKPGGQWWPLIDTWRRSSAGRVLISTLDQQLQRGATIYPAQVFRALELTPPDQVQVLIVGQDPYHGPGQAEGLAFSVADGQPWPPSLRNIFAELQRDPGVLPRPQTRPRHQGSLKAWAEQGVLLLNTSLTVLAGQPGSHSQIGWHALTDKIFQSLWERDTPTVFMLWGAHAQQRARNWQIDAIARDAPAVLVTPTPGPGPSTAGPHRVLRSNHPSPLAARRPPLPFIGNAHFSAANQHLRAHGRPGVDWGRQKSDASARGR